MKPITDFSKKCDTYDGLTSRCKSCLAEVRKATYVEQREQILAKNTAWYAENKAAVTAGRKDRFDSEKNKTQCRSYYEANKAKVRKMNDAWAAANPEKVREAWRNYGKRNQANRNAISAKRRASKRNQYPLWDRELTDFVSTEASSLARIRGELFGFKWHVDHVVPLRGKEVRGLHVWNNLQVIPGVLNARKSNKLEVAA